MRLTKYLKHFSYRPNKRSCGGVLIPFTGTAYGHYHFCLNLINAANEADRKYQMITCRTSKGFDEGVLVSDLGLQDNVEIVQYTTRLRTFVRYCRLAFFGHWDAVIFNTKLFSSWPITAIFSIVFRLTGKRIVWIVHEIDDRRLREVSAVEKFFCFSSLLLANKKIALSSKVKTDLARRRMTSELSYHPIYDMVDILERDQTRNIDKRQPISIIIFNPRFFKGLREAVYLENNCKDSELRFCFLGRSPEEEERFLKQNLLKENTLVINEYLPMKSLLRKLKSLPNAVHFMAYNSIDTSGALMLFGAVGIPSVTTKNLAEVAKFPDLLHRVEKANFRKEELQCVVRDFDPSQARSRYGWEDLIAKLP